MMEETGEREVSFTCKGDREVVKYNFFKMCFNMLGDADEARITPIRTATSVEVCAESQSLRV
jgi:hypothetical protein